MGARPVLREPHDNIMLRLLTRYLLTAAIMLTPLAAARDSIEASPFGMVLADVLTTFHASEVPCDDGANEAPEVCFVAVSVGASYLAERLSELVIGYGSTGLHGGSWRSANGVWAVSLSFENRSYGKLEIYLAEAPDNCVRGLVRLVSP